MSVFITGACKFSSVHSVFANNTWKQIIEACQSGEVPDTWKVGDSKTMTIDGTEYTIDIIGKNHDVYSDGTGTAPLTFQIHDCYGTKYAMNSANSNSGGWGSCLMRSTHLPAILALMPSEVQSAIREVNKLTSEGNKSTVIETTADKLFLLSEIEVIGSTLVSVAGEGVQYAYYAAGNSCVKNLNGNGCYWVLRSPTKTTNMHFILIKPDGDYQDYQGGNGNENFGVAFAFCF